MYTQTIFLAVAAALAATSNAAIVQLYNDPGCTGAVAERNVYDNSCAPTGGFQSYKITSGGGAKQRITTYSKNYCADENTSCNDSHSINVCYEATNSEGGSNALSSGEICGAF